MEDKFREAYLKAAEEVKKRKALRRKQLEEAEKELIKKKAELDHLHTISAEGKRLISEHEKLDADLWRRWFEERRKKAGAGWKWKGELGYHLIAAVKALTADGSSQAQAFRDLCEWSYFWRAHPIRRKTRRFRDVEADPRWIRLRRLAGEHWQYLRDECRYLKPRALAARHYDALKAWDPYFERDQALDIEVERFRAMHDAVTKTDKK